MNKCTLSCHLPQQPMAAKVPKTAFPLITMRLWWKAQVWILAHGGGGGGGCHLVTLTPGGGLRCCTFWGDCSRGLQGKNEEEKSQLRLPFGLSCPSCLMRGAAAGVWAFRDDRSPPSRGSDGGGTYGLAARKKVEGNAADEESRHLFTRALLEHIDGLCMGGEREKVVPPPRRARLHLARLGGGMRIGRPCLNPNLGLSLTLDLLCERLADTLVELWSRVRTRNLARLGMLNPFVPEEQRPVLEPTAWHVGCPSNLKRDGVNGGVLARRAYFFDHSPPVPVFAPISPNNLEYLLALSKNWAHPLHPVYDNGKGSAWKWE